MLTEFDMVVVGAAAGVLYGFVVLPSGVDLRAGVWTERVINIDETIVMRVSVMVGVFIDLLEDTAIGIGVDVLTGVNTKLLAATMADLGFIVMATSLAYSLFFC